MWRKRRDPRVGDELRFHRDRLIDDYIAAGMSRPDAERRAFIEFGNVPQIQEAVLDARGRWLGDLLTDIRYALRTLRRNPAFSIVAVTSLALGIGANAAIFSVINGVLLRPLPVNEPDRLVQLTRLISSGPEEGRPGLVNYPLFEQIRDHVGSVSAVFAQATADQAIAVDGEDEFAAVDLVSGEYSTVLQLVPAAGRLLGPADDVPAATAAMIGDGYWQRRFGRHPSAVGKSVRIRGRDFTIVGVMPTGFPGARRGRIPDVVLPLAAVMSDVQRRRIDFNSLNVLARLAPGASVEQAEAELRVVFAAFVRAQAEGAAEKDRPAILRQRAVAVAAPDGFNPVRYEVARPLLILAGIVAVILLLACVNVSGLLLARAAARQREISIRLAIGAGRGRLLRQFLTESLVLAVLGGTAGLAIAGWFGSTLLALFLSGRDIVLSAGPDWRVVAFTAAISLLACGIAGFAPALRASRVQVNPGLKVAAARGHGRLGTALVVAQLAMSMVLVVAATLFIGTLVKLYGVDKGFDSDGTLVIGVRTAQPYPEGRIQAVQRAVLDRLSAIPGVQSATAAQTLPVGGGLWDRSVQVEGYVFRPDESEHVGFNVIAPDYFATMGTPIVSGREFDARDIAASPRVAIVNEAFARYFFGSGSAVGRRVTSVNVTYEIVGVVRDAKYQDLREPVIRTMYICWTQREGDQPTRYSYLVRSAGDPMRLVPSLDGVVREADPALRIRTARTYRSIVDQSIATERIMATLGGAFAVLALIVAGIGMFGVLAFQVARRTNELGVRMALGATRSRMMGVVLRDVALMVVAGVSIGGAVALMLAGLADRIVFGLTPTDPAVFAVAASVLSAVAIVAGWLPARRASRVDPLVALRHE